MSAAILKNSPAADAFHSTLVWETPWAGAVFLLAALALVAFAAWQLHRHGLSRQRVVILTALRAVPVIFIAILLARPTWVFSQEEEGGRHVVLLMDRSASMGLEDVNGAPRYKDALALARDTVVPFFQNAGYKIQPMLFDAAAEKADATALVNAQPAGKATDLGGAIATGMASTPRQPVAVVALTDGASNRTESNRQAVGALLAGKVPFFGIGFGTENGVQTLNLLQVDAPEFTPPKSKFRISARIEATVSGPLPPFDLMLLRDGKFHERRRVQGTEGSRFWSESFEVTEEEEGMRTYHVEIAPPSVPGLVVINKDAKATVHVTQERSLRVLYMQGALTWDYKFIGKALREDPTVHVTGLSRTSERSVFRQNVEAPGELVEGFPDDVKELAPFRAVVLANLKPSQLSPAQQEAIAAFCGNFGGGVLMIGGRGTFDSSWRGSRLEQLLPVRFDEDRGVHGLDPAFQLRLTPEALADPVFEIDDPGKNQEAWSRLPPFDDYGRVAEAKPGATVWAVHSKDTGPDGKPRILMAGQPYGSGFAAVITVQNFWRWRLAREAAQEQFDRFWQQFIRRLGQSGRQEMRIEVLDQELRPDREIAVTVERLANASEPDSKEPRKIHFSVSSSDGEKIAGQQLELQTGRPERVTFVPKKGDLYTLAVTDEANVELSSRILEIRAPNVEFQTTGRDMPALQQWAMLSGGSAWTAEAIRQDPAAFTWAIKSQLEAARASRMQRRPAGINWWVFGLVALPLCAGWILRKRWMLA